METTTEIRGDWQDKLQPLRDVCKNFATVRDETIKPSGGYHLYCYREYPDPLSENGSPKLVGYAWTLKDSSLPRLRVDRMARITQNAFSDWERRHC